MDVPRDERQEEPNVVPLIDVSLVILVMALVINSVAGRLLSFSMPKADKTRFVEAPQAVPLKVLDNGAYQLGLKADLDKPALGEALRGLEPGTVVALLAGPATPFEHVVAAMDMLRENPDLGVAFGKSAPTTAAPQPGARAEDR